MNDETKDLKNEEQEAQKEQGSTWIIAVVMMLVGGGLLLSNFTGISFDNWWAFFLFIPAGFMLQNVWADYKRNGRITGKSTGFIIGGLSILVMIAVFLFDLSWSGLWPLAFIFGGIAVLLGSRK